VTREFVEVLREESCSAMSKRLVVVDDGEKLLRAIGIILRQAGYEVATASSGEDALVLINEQVPDLIISDINMPGINGIELARSLRSTASTSIIPIIFLSALDELESRIASFRAGVDACVAKPFEPDELLRVIVSILEK
jgi:DNA-binding response OmpR family regulator